MNAGLSPWPVRDWRKLAEASGLRHDLFRRGVTQIFRSGSCGAVALRFSRTVLRGTIPKLRPADSTADKNDVIHALSYREGPSEILAQRPPAVGPDKTGTWPASRTHTLRYEVARRNGTVRTQYIPEHQRYTHCDRESRRSAFSNRLRRRRADFARASDGETATGVGPRAQRRTAKGEIERAVKTQRSEARRGKHAGARGGIWVKHTRAAAATGAKQTTTTTTLCTTGARAGRGRPRGADGGGSSLREPRAQRVVLQPAAVALRHEPLATSGDRERNLASEPRFATRSKDDRPPPHPPPFDWPRNCVILNRF